MMTNARAQQIASDYHGGGGSALYALASSGAIRPDCEREIRAELKAPIYTAEQRAELTELWQYVTHAGERGPVPLWAKIATAEETRPTFSYGDPAAIAAAVDHARQLPEGKYPVQLNASDLATVLRALAHFQETSSDESDADEAGSLYSDILATLEVEVI